MVCYKKKQRKCAAEMGYNISPERMMCKKNVAVLVFGIHYGTSNQFGYEIIAGIQTAAIDKNYEGIFFLGFRPHIDFIERNRGHNIPMVVLDNYIENPLVARVGCDNADGITQAVKYLYAKGHRKIGFLGCEADSIVTIERKKAYADNLTALGIPVSESIIKYGHFSGKGIKRMVLDIAKENVTAIVCISDVLASNDIKEHTKAGYRVPQDISITGYDNLPISECCVPPLTTIYQNRLHIGKAAFFTLQQIKSGIQIRASYTAGGARICG